MNPVIRGNSLYTIVDGLSWTEAEANAVKVGGNLVSINSIEEFNWGAQNAWSTSNYLANGRPSSYSLSFTGFNDSLEEGNYSWSSGEPMEWENPTDLIVAQNWFDQQNSFGSWDYGLVALDAGWDAIGADERFDYSDRGNIILMDNEASFYRDTGANLSGIAETPFIRRGDSAYVIVEGPTWEEAEANAVALGGHLVTINDAQENQWLVQNYYGKDLLSETLENKSVWIGYNDIKKEGNWEWSSGETSNYQNWGSGEPDGRETYKAGEEYTEFLLFDSYNRDPGQWGDNANNANRLGIAEIPLAPNNAPTGTPTLTGNFKVGETINIDASAIEDVDNFEGWTPTYEYSWEVSNDNGTNWTALTSSDATDGDVGFTITSAEVGKQLRGVVSYLDGYGTNEVVESGASLLIQPVDQGSGSAGVITSDGGLQEGVTLIAPEVSGDPNGDVAVWADANPEYQWLKDGVAITGAIGSSYQVPVDAIAAAEEVADYSVEIVYTDGEGFRNTDSPVRSSAAEVEKIDNGDAGYQLQTNGAAISGAVAIGSVITAAQIAGDLDGNLLNGSSVGYEWQTAAAGTEAWSTVGTESTYTATTADSGKDLQLLIRYRDGQGYQEELAALTAEVNDVPISDWIFRSNLLNQDSTTFGEFDINKSGLISFAENLNTQDAYEAGIHRLNADGVSIIAEKFSINSGWSSHGSRLGSSIQDQAGNIYFSLQQKESPNGKSGQNDSDPYVVKLDNQGNVLWINNYGDTLDEISGDIELDRDGNIWINGRASNERGYISGNSYQGAPFGGGWKGFQHQISPDGTKLATYTLGSFNSGGQYLESDTSNNIVIGGGYTFGSVNGVGTKAGDPAGASHYLVGRNASTGDVVWTIMHDWIRSNIALSEQRAEFAVLNFNRSSGLASIKVHSTKTGESLREIEVASETANLHYADNGSIFTYLAEGSIALISEYNIYGDLIKEHQFSSSSDITAGAIKEGAFGELLISGSTSGQLDHVGVVDSGGSNGFLLSLGREVTDEEVTPVIRGNSLYTIVDGPNWNDSQAYSQTLGGNLASITSAEENEFIRSSFENANIGYEATGSADVYLIGLYRDNADSLWKWANEEEVSYLNFGRFEPYNGGSYAAMNTFKTGEKTDNYWGADAGSWSDGYGRNSQEIFGSEAYGIAEIPLNLSITTSSTPTEGAGVFTTSINLSAGTEASGNLAEGAEVYWTVSGITADDLESGELEGSGVITDGVLEIEHSLVEDYDSGESFDVSVFSDAERTQQIGVTEEFAIEDNSPAPVIRGNSFYTIVEGPNWNDAQAYSQTLGGNLASITSAEENEFIRSSFENADIGYEATGPDVFLIGLYRDDADSLWKWVSEEEVSYLNFGPYEPYNGGMYAAMNTFKIGEKIGDGWGADAGSWSDGYGRNSQEVFDSEAYGIAEIPLGLEIKTSDSPTEGAGVFTTSINLSAGTEASGNLAEGAEVYWSISGITADDLESGELEGSGVITDGVLEIEHSLVEDYDSGESFDVAVFSDAERTQQIGLTEEFAIADESPTPVIRGNSLYTTVEGPTWEKAQSNAFALGGNLVTILDEEENLFVANSFSDTNLGYTDGKAYDDPLFRSIEEDIYWIGLTKASGSWEWVTGESLSNYQNWGPLEPFQDLGTLDRAAMTTEGYENVAPWVESAGNWDNNLGEWYGIAEIPLNLSVATSNTPTEGAGVFTTSINLSAGTETSGNLAEGAEVYWTVSGITADDLASGALSGSGVITDGKLSIEHSLLNDDDSGETFNVSVFSDAEMTQQIGETQSFEVLEGESDPITGEMGLRRKVKLKNRGKVSFRLYGSEEIDVNAIDFDSILFGGDPEALMADAPAADDYFQGAQRTKGKRAGSYIAKVKDLNYDGFDDIVMKAFRRDLVGVIEKGDTGIYAYAQMGGESVLWGNTDTVFF